MRSCYSGCGFDSRADRNLRKEGSVVVKAFSGRSLSALVAVGMMSSVAAADTAAGGSRETAQPLGYVADVKATWPSFSEADQAYNDAILRGIDIEHRVAELKADTGGSGAQRARRLFLASLLQWRHGFREDALASIRDALKLGRHGELLRHEGRLLEAAGNNREAMQSYREAIPLLSGEAALNTELRLALLTVSESADIEPLLSLAERSDGAFRNRIAMALAVLGHPGKAAGLYTLRSDASDEQKLRYYLRLTEWTLQDKNVLETRQNVWQALKLADARQDRFYALALLTESHRLDDSLPELIEKLEGERDLGDVARSLWVSLLREIDRPEDALAMLKGRVEKEPRQVKREFVGIYRESDRTGEMVTELERLMGVDPDETVWPQGLAEFYLERGDRQAARAVWQAFVDGCSKGSSLLTGAEVMKKLNFDELALAAAEKAQRDPASIRPAAIFRFEFYLDRGRQDEARQVLEELENTTGAADPARKTVALSYERLSKPKEALRVMMAFAGSGAEQDVAAKQYLAHLLVSAGEAEKAVDYLLASLPEAAASQRRLVQSRVIAAARAAGTVDRLVSDLTEKLHNDTATNAEIQMLLEMHTRASQEGKALSLIETLYDKPGADEVEKLKQIAALHRSLSKWRAYDTTLAELAERDPDNALFHIRGRIVNYIDNLRPYGSDIQLSAAVTSEGRETITLAALLQQYSEVAGAGAGREFHAGVLAMARQHRQALTMFREVVAADPSRLDSYRAIGDQLAAMRRGTQAVATYQYLVESTHREDISWVVLDGMIDLGAGQKTLKWAQRMALERLTGKPDTFDYYRQLADLSERLGDNELQLSALHNGLSAEPQLRASVLRELLRITGSDVDGEGLSLKRRHVAFSHRLLALGLAMPPDVYIALGEAMSGAGDSNAALRAVTQAVEHTGSRELLVQAADVFQQAGDELSAHRLFEKALAGDPGNISLLVKTVESNERLEKDARASELVLIGIATLLKHQMFEVEELVVSKGLGRPVEAQDDALLAGLLLDEGREIFPDGYSHHRGSTHSHEYQQYYIPLRNSLVRVLSADERLRETILNELWGDYHSTLAAVSARQGKLPWLANYPRLNLQAQLLRYLSYTFGDYAAVNEMDEALLEQFPEDPRLPEVLVSHRMEWGGIDYLGWLNGSTVLSDEQKRQLKEHWTAADSTADDGLLAVKASAWESGFLQGTSVSRSSLTLAQRALRRELDAAVRSGDSSAVVDAVKRLVETDLIWETLHEVESQLSAEEKKLVAGHVITILHDDRDKAASSLVIPGGLDHNYDLKTKRLSWAARLSEWSGGSVLEEELLLELTSEPELSQPVFDLWFVYQSLSATNRKKWLEQRVTNSNGWSNDTLYTGAPGVAGTESLIVLLLQVEQDTASGELLKRTAAEHDGLTQLSMIDKLIEVDIHPGNIALARELVAIAAQKYSKHLDPQYTHTPNPLLEPNLLRSEGKIDEALHSMVNIFLEGEFPPMRPQARTGYTGGDAMSFVEDYQVRLVEGNETRLVEILNDAESLSPMQQKYRNYWLVGLDLSLNRSHPEKMLSVVLDALESDPENLYLLELAADLYAQTGQAFAVHELMRKRLSHMPEGRRFSLFNNERIEQLGRLMQSARGLDNPVSVLAYREVLGQPSPAMTSAESAPDDWHSINRVLTGDDYARLKRVMERLWQTVQVGERMKNSTPSWGVSRIEGIYLNQDELNEFVFAMLRGQLQGQMPEPVLMLPVLAKHPLGAEILEGWVKSVRGRKLGEIQSLIDALADAHVHNGSAEARFAELTAGIRERRVGDKELSLWLAIGSRVPTLAAGDEAGAFLSDYMQSESAYRPVLLTGMAGFLTARGDREGALKCFRSLIDWVRGQPHMSARRDGFSLNAILRTAGEVLDTQTYHTLLRAELDSAKPWREDLVPSYSEFVLNLFDAAEDQQAFYRAFGSDVDSAISSFAGSDDVTFKKSARLIRVAITQHKLGKQVVALDTLKRAMELKTEEEREGEDERLAQYRSGLLPTRVLPDWSVAANGITPAMANYREQLGFNSLQLDLRSVVQTHVLPATALPGLLFSNADLPGLKLAESRIRDWIDADDIDRNMAITMLLSLAHSYRDSGAERELSRLFTYLRTQLAHRDEMTLITLAAMVAEAEALGQTLNDLELEKELLIKGTIKPEYMAAVLKRIARAEGDAEALKVGGTLLEYTLEDTLMDELIALAERTGAEDQAREWLVLQKKAQIARKELQQMAPAI